MASVALCIPTYQRHECVGEFLKEYAGYYQKYDIDIYYYDSSPDDKTFSVVKKFSDKNAGFILCPYACRNALE